MTRHTRFATIYVVVGIALIVVGSIFSSNSTWVIAGAAIMGVGGGVWAGGEMKK